MKAVPPGHEKVCVCLCSDCVEIHTRGYLFCDCKGKRRIYWNNFKRVLAELIVTFSSSSSVFDELSRPRYSFVELYRHRMDSAVEEALSSLARATKVFPREDSNGEETFEPIFQRVRSFCIPTPDYGFLADFQMLRYSSVWSGGGKWYSKLLSKLEPLYQSAHASVSAAVEQHNKEATEACEERARRAQRAQRVVTKRQKT